jgi:hypothetical protein
MSCSRFRRRWEPGGPEDHATTCAACAEWLAGQRRAAAALAHLAARLDDATRPAERAAELRSAFRQARHPVAEPRQRTRAFVLVAAAACLVAAVGFALRRTAPSASARATTSTLAPASAPVQVATASAPPATAAAPSLTGSVGAGPARPSSPSARATAVVPTSTAAVPDDPAASPPLSSFDQAVQLHPARPAEAPVSVPAAPDDADGFYPLLPDAPRATLESGQIVRVQLRPDVLDAAGLPRRAMPAQGPVEAEVLVGPDGVARGIRLAKPAIPNGRER